jgi:hypothetical protein
LKNRYCISASIMGVPYHTVPNGVNMLPFAVEEGRKKDELDTKTLFDFFDFAVFLPFVWFGAQLLLKLIRCMGEGP